MRYCIPKDNTCLKPTYPLSIIWFRGRRDKSYLKLNKPLWLKLPLLNVTTIFDSAVLLSDCTYSIIELNTSILLY